VVCEVAFDTCCVDFAAAAVGASGLVDVWEGT
jgi:hypothetical protein